MATLRAQPAILLRRHADIFIKSAVKAAAGAETGGQGDIEDGLIGVAEQRPNVINAHRGNVLLHGLLHHPLKNPHRVVGIQLHMLGDIVDGERPIVVDGNIFQHLADVKLGVARNAVLMRA